MTSSTPSDFRKIALKAAPRKGTHLHGTSAKKRSIDSLALKQLIMQRKETHDVHSQKNLDNKMHRQAMKQLR